MREFTCYLLSTANRIKGQVHKSIVFERSLGHQTWDLHTRYYIIYYFGSIINDHSLGGSHRVPDAMRPTIKCFSIFHQEHIFF